MPSYIEKVESATLPVIALRGTVAFPLITVNFEAADERASAAAKQAGLGSSFLFLTSYKETENEEVEEEFPFYHVGTVVRIKQMLRTPEGSTRIVAEGVVRATVARYRYNGNAIEADLICKHVTLPDLGGGRG